MGETILIVDDEETVRRTFAEWLADSGMNVRIQAVPDAEQALLTVHQTEIDLAILDWNLGSGTDGLRLLEDLIEFQPDIVAILVTGFADRATPLDALRMGVRDYLDKNQELNRESFLRAVRKQLDQIRPAKQQRQFHRSLAAFREAVEKVLPIVQTSVAMSDPVPLPRAIGRLMRFLLDTTRAADGVLIVRHGEDAPRAYAADGQLMTGPLVPFSRSLAATVASLGEVGTLTHFDAASLGAVELQWFEQGRSALLAAPLTVGAGVQAVLELFDKPGGFTAEDRRTAQAAAEFGSELLRQALADKQTHHLLFDAIEAALHASASLSASAPVASEHPLPPEIMDRLRQGLTVSPLDSGPALELAEAVRGLAVRHGPAAVRHCVRLIESVRTLLDEALGPIPDPEAARTTDRLTTFP